MHLSLAKGARAIDFFEVIEVSALNDVVRGEPDLVYPSPKWGSIVGKAQGVDIDDG